MDAAVKCNKKAVEIRQRGNQFYHQKKFDNALARFNKSICYAENDSEDLGIGFANRSALCYEIKEYEFALANIALARSHNYPERLLPKLDKREQDCLQKMSEKSPQEKVNDAALRSRLAINVEVNPRIPFIARDIHLEERPAGYGQNLIADRDFKVGDILAEDRPLLNCASPCMSYYYCDCCTTQIWYNLIPCRHCASVMYCGEECLQKGWKHYHRFECGLTEQLHEVFEETKISFIGPRLFFYALGVLNDDIAEMMKFCTVSSRTGGNPLDLDYVNYDPLEELKQIFKLKIRPIKMTKERLLSDMAARKYLNIFRESALVKSLVATIDQVAFMAEQFADFISVFLADTNDRPGVVKLSVICTVFCVTDDRTKEQNVSIISGGPQFRFVIHQAVTKGSQLCHRMSLPAPFIEKNIMHRSCSFIRDLSSEEWHAMCQLTRNENDDLDMLDALQHSLQIHSSVCGHNLCYFKQSQVMSYLTVMRSIMAKFMRAEFRARAVA